MRRKDSPVQKKESIFIFHPINLRLIYFEKWWNVKFKTKEPNLLSRFQFIQMEGSKRSLRVDFNSSKWKNPNGP
jgi:hypothetical protein